MNDNLSQIPYLWGSAKGPHTVFFQFPLETPSWKIHVGDLHCLSNLINREVHPF